jgi:hypothetical protein
MPTLADILGSQFGPSRFGQILPGEEFYGQTYRPTDRSARV